MPSPLSNPIPSVAAAALLGLSCVSCGGASLPGDYSILNAQPAADKTFLSKRILILADEQVHYLYGKPGWIRSEFTDQLVSTAIRPVQLDFFGRYLLEWMVDQTKTDVPLVFLGDALDFSCTQEWDIFRTAIQGTRGARTWAMAPGNHDGYYFGNYQPAGPDKKDWTDACSSGDSPGTPMNKADFVTAYLRAVAEEADPGAQQIKQKLAPSPGTVLPKGSWEYPGTGPDRPFFRAIAWNIDKVSPWRSFVVQEVDLTLAGSPRRVTAILIDTSAYSDPPSLLPTSNVAVNGDLPPAELDWVRRWLAKDDAEKAAPLIMGHHTFNGLSGAAQKALDGMRSEYAVPLWVSAHTHLGQWFVHASHGGWLELNLGSTLDYPPEYRLFDLSRSMDKLLVTGELHRPERDWLTELSETVRCEPSWEALPEDQDFYITYKTKASPSAEKTQDDLMTALLHTHQRLLGSTEPMKKKPEKPLDGLATAPGGGPAPRWPAGCASDACVLAAIGEALATQGPTEKVKLLVQLDDFERSRKAVNEPLHTQYRLCQAMWASREQRTGVRAPLVDDWVISLPYR